MFSLRELFKNRNRLERSKAGVLGGGLLYGKSDLTVISISQYQKNNAPTRNKSFTMNTAKPRLVPFKVPWKVSPSTPFLSLYASESPRESPTHVRFVASFGMNTEFRPSVASKVPTIVFSPYKSNMSSGPKEGPVQLVRITFTNATEARIAGAYSDRSAIDYSAFDCSAMELRPDEQVFDIQTRLNNFRESWVRTGICPKTVM